MDCESVSVSVNVKKNIQGENMDIAPTKQRSYVAVGCCSYFGSAKGISHLPSTM